MVLYIYFMRNALATQTNTLYTTLQNSFRKYDYLLKTIKFIELKCSKEINMEEEEEVEEI